MPLKKALTYVNPDIPAQIAADPAPKAVKVEPSPAYTGGRKSTGDTMSKADWAAKDVRISRQGLFQAALQSPAIMQYAPDVATYLELVGLVAETGLGFVNESAADMGNAIAKAAAVTKR